MTPAGPEVSFVRSEYFSPLPPEQTVCPAMSLRLLPGASDSDRRELEEYANWGLKAAVLPWLKVLRIEDPYWTWDGKLVEKSSLPPDYPYSRGWRGLWQEYRDRLPGKPPV